MFKKLRLILRLVVWLAAALFVLQIAVTITGPPRFLTNWLTATDLPHAGDARVVVVLGGGGIPSESGLLRCYIAAQTGATLTNATFIVSLPADGDPETSSVGRMRDELVMRGIPAASIQMETRGLNTHQQAVNIAGMLDPKLRRQPLLIVTSGYHMRRCLLSFRKAGFEDVQCLTATGIGAEADAGKLTWLRYGMWSNWSKENEIMREMVALILYKLRGWV